MKKISTIRVLLFFLLSGLLSYQTANSQVTVSGHLNSPNNGILAGYAVLVSGTETKVAYTDFNGEYSFELQEGGSYEIRPIDCDHSVLNGVTTYDMVLVSKHMDGSLPITDPYKLIAADLDATGTIDSTDLNYYSELVLGIIQDLPAGNWQFVPQNYVFPDPGNPFSPPFPHTITISNLQAQGISDADFFGIKVGDVNNSTMLNQECGSPVLPAVISGKVFHDEALTCLYDPSQPVLSNWNISASDGVNSYYGTSNQNGDYNIFLFPGVYDLVLTTPNDLWAPCSDTIHQVFVDIDNSASVDLPVQALGSCPALEVNISTARLRRCFNNTYTIFYCNFGTEVAQDAYVEFEMDPFFDYISSSIPGTLISGNTYSFDLGDIPVGYCGQFNVTFLLNCDAEAGQTHCSEARIYPDDICGEAASWEGADLHVQGECDGTDVKFTITNNGGDMGDPGTYIVIEDIVVMIPPVQNPIWLAAGESEVITIPSNGTTVRLEVKQPTGHPWADKASATVEGCGTLPGGGFSTGMVNLFALSDETPIFDIDCVENIGSYDPNDKQGIPLGVMAEHFVPTNQNIEYTIRFQNTGTDTAFTVIIRDTLDNNFDISSIRPLGSSHPYSFNLSGSGVAQFVFTDIMLPDSNVNEAASHGYVKYSIRPKAGATEGLEVRNNAGIYFDFNEPVITNTTLHTLGSRFLSSSNISFNPEIGVEVYPNPTNDLLNFTIKSRNTVEGSIDIYDLSGHLVTNQKFKHNKFQVNAKELKPGYYVYKIRDKHNDLATGKVIVLE